MADTTGSDASGTEAADSLRDIPLDRFFHPRVVAFVGASATKGSSTRLLYYTVKRKVEAEGGVVHPVNPGRDEIDGVRCYRSIHDIEGPVDLAVIAAGDPVGILEDVVGKHPLFVMIFAAGFAEAGAEGQALQDRMRQIVRDSGVYLLGPNTTLNSFLPLRNDLPGKALALISHSGHQGRHIWQGQDIGIPMAYWAPTGNEVDLEFADFVKYFSGQERVGAICGYVEGFKSGAKLRRAAELTLAAGVPLVVVKVGLSELGQSTAMSHTAHLAGSDAVADAVFEQLGIIRVHGIDELLYTSAFLARSAPPRADGVCVYGISGGTLAHLSDLLSAAGVSVPPLTGATQAALREWIPGYLRVSNPVDSGGAPSGDWRGRHILQALVDDPGVGVVVCPFVANAYQLSDAVVRDVVEVAATTDKPVCLVWGSPTANEPVYQEILTSSPVVTFRTFGQCVTALKGYFDYHRARARAGAPTPVPTRPAAGPVDLPAGRTLSEAQSKAVLAAYGIPVSRDRLVGSADQAVAAADDLGYPVVLKINSPDIAHKSDLGLVRLGLADGASVATAFHALTDRAAEVAPDARVDGVLVAPELSGGVETVLGLTHDEVFGPVVMVGLGGVFAEVLADVAFRAPPFGRAEARAMVDGLKGRALLAGVRGAPPADVDALLDAVMAVQQLALDHGGRIAELDVNPLLVRPDGAVALDALVRTFADRPGGPPEAH
jgi:acyl-CoA synthetase (NDP forming)